ncbi:hypothetical protein AMELA_G00263760 [Ameiurus melas]|uniref:Tight junction protein ZO-2 n=1 Tax=Ameiurus melas TaxID=219545 RepID=A0A7J5ZPB5_AMEME|nr:hypothetical protein AMELA_G00263760 [Ameiurus melas]
MESYRSYSPQDDQRSRLSDISSHSSNELPRESAREEPQNRLAKTPLSPYKVGEEPPAVQIEQEDPPEEPPAPIRKTPKILLRPSPEDEEMYGPNTMMVSFQKGESVGLRLAGGNDVGIFIAGVQEGSPAEEEGLRVGDQIMKVNNVDFRGIVREEAVLFLLELPRGDIITILAQSKADVYKDILVSGRGDSFFIRTHFDYEKEQPQCLAFSRGDIFKVVDTLYDGKLGNWLAIRMGKDNQLLEKGIIPNKSRAEQMTNVQHTPKTSTSDRADFWRLRGQRAAKKKDLRKTREDMSLVSTRFPAYERVVLREAGFRRPVVLFGPIADAASEKLATELPEEFVVAKTEPKDAGKSCSHLFTVVIDLNAANDAWYGSVKDCIRQQQTQAVWVSEGKLDGTAEGDLDLHDDRMSYLSAMSADYLSMDSRVTSDYDDTADEGGAYTDNEPEETLERQRVSAISRSSEPVMPEEILRKSSPEIRFNSRVWVVSRESLVETSPPIMSTFLPEPPKVIRSASPAVIQVKPLAQGETPHGHFTQPRDPNASNSANIEHHHIQNSPSITKPLPPPIALKPTSVPRATRGLMDSPIKDRERPERSPEDPSKKSFLGKLKAFEKMDQFARAQRVLEIQQAQDARLEIAQKHPDIYAVPIKSPKLDHSRPQPIGSSARPEPQTPPSKVPYSDSISACPSKDDTVEEEYRQQSADPTKHGYYQNKQEYQDTEL